MLKLSGSNRTTDRHSYLFSLITLDKETMPWKAKTWIFLAANNNTFEKIRILFQQAQVVLSYSHNPFFIRYVPKGAFTYEVRFLGKLNLILQNRLM